MAWCLDLNFYLAKVAVFRGDVFFLPNGSLAAGALPPDVEGRNEVKLIS